MIVSWNWLQDYVSAGVEPAEVERRLMMSGLNHEGTEKRADDLAIDLEVTSNRPDCLGHIGVAREVAVLFDAELKIPAVEPKEGTNPIHDLAKVRIDCPDLCARYTARVIRGAKIGPSPDWLATRLRNIGIAVINNVVDITNFVMMECGQPLHAFDFAELEGGEIIVREARKGEPFVAIDHKTYALDAGMCVIADAKKAVALGGVMGGESSEVSDATTDILVEAAEFAQLSIRGTARKLNLHSPSSYRFERGVDPETVDWASRRCCELILELAGGELASGVIDVGRAIPRRDPIVLRLAQLRRILGIEIPAAEVRRILQALGNQIVRADDTEVEVVPPNWRRDLTREIDLVEEAARIHGYEKIPEDVAVPMWPSHRSDEDRVLDKVRKVLTAVGLDEALTSSMVPPEWSDSFSPWSDAPPITSTTPMKGVLADAPKELGQADTLRRSLVPSLLEARRYNESLANSPIELFETATVYLPGKNTLPVEQLSISMSSGGSYIELKGVLEELVSTMNRMARLEIRPGNRSFLDPAKSAEIWLDDELWGYLGEVTSAGLKRFGLRNATTIAEVRFAPLARIANLIPQNAVQSPYPPIDRDLNLVVDEQVKWADVEGTVRGSAGPNLESIDYRETYRDAKKDGQGKKRLLLSIALRAADRTLTNEEADSVRDGIVNACLTEHGARLLG